jgi:hypothetical protein
MLARAKKVGITVLLPLYTLLAFLSVGVDPPLRF